MHSARPWSGVLGLVAVLLLAAVVWDERSLPRVLPAWAAFVQLRGSSERHQQQSQKWQQGTRHRRPLGTKRRRPLRRQIVTTGDGNNANVDWQKLPPCAQWGCQCGHQSSLYPFNSSLDYHERHYAVKSLAQWRTKAGDPCPEVYQAASPCGYRTRAKLAVGPASRDAPGKSVVGLFRKNTFHVVPSSGCAVNHPVLAAAILELQAVLDKLRGTVIPYDHEIPATRVVRKPSLRYVEMTVERGSGLVQLVLVWNGGPDCRPPALYELIERLWPRQRHPSTSTTWHSIWIHWRKPERKLQKAIESKDPNAWQLVRPSAGSLEVLEELDGLPFAFGPASFQQGNLGVFERILRDMKTALHGLRLHSSERRLHLLELCAGVGVIGLSLAHATSTWQGSGGVSLLSTDWNLNGGGPFTSNARRIFPGLFSGAVEVKFEPWSIDEALDKLVQGAVLGGRADVLVIDPPWRGLAQHHRPSEGGFIRGDVTARKIRQCESLRAVIYMACGHQAFMADADRLTGRDPDTSGSDWGPPFQLTTLKCYDMFPMNPSHVEVLGVFMRSTTSFNEALKLKH